MQQYVSVLAAMILAKMLVFAVNDSERKKKLPLKKNVEFNDSTIYVI